MITRLNNNSVKLCCKGKGCPVITKIDENTYEVTDDQGNKIIVTKAELKLMSDAATTLDKDNRQLLCE
jgi:hypothetical protein